MTNSYRRKETIGDATLYLGDCLEILPTLPKVDAVVTDPPYSSGGAFRADRAAPTTTKYQINHETQRTYAAFSGDNRDQRSFEIWCERWMSKALQLCDDGAGIGCFIDWRNLASVVDSIQVAGWVFRGITPWHKGTDLRPNKGWFRRNIEFVVWGSAGPLLTGAKAEGECWDGMFVARVNDGDKHHQTGKPVELMSQMVSVRPEWRIYLDPFMGSGSTGVACARAGHSFIGIEIDDHSFDIACERIAAAYAQGRLFA